jgi:hypothetical protein
MGRIAVILVAVIYAPVLLAQQSAPSFEVASVKPSAPGASLQNPGELLPGGRWTIQGAPLAFILRVAFDLRADQLSGGPPWINTERFDINARAAGIPGLSGTFDIDLDYIPQELVVASEPAVGLPLIAAYEQQLGLKFERRRETTDVLVIDSVARPTPD